MRPPTIPLPTFNGEFMEWPAFIENFKASVAKFNIVNEADKASYLQAAIKCKEALDLVEEEAKSCSYSGMMENLNSRYDQSRKYYRKLVQGLFVDKPIEDPIRLLARFQNQVLGTIRRLQCTKFNSVDHLYRALAELQMDPVIFTEWGRYSAKHNDVPPITELEEFAVECRRLLDRVDKT